MNKFIRQLVLIISVLVFQVNSANATLIVHYENMPITVYLSVGQERSIHFGDHVKVGITKRQQSRNLFRSQSAQGVLHVRPNKVFDKQRIQVQRMTDGRVILIDLISEDEKGEKLEDVKIVLESENTVKTERNSPTAVFEMPLITPVDLTRYASQHLYGPARLHQEVSGITSISLGVKGAIKIFKGANKHQTLSIPVVAYQGGSYNLAGIHIKNTSDRAVQLNYLDLNLPFSHATFQHHSLTPAGSPGDSTILYLISEMSLKETLHPWTYYQDKKSEVENAVRAEKKKNKNQPRRDR